MVRNKQALAALRAGLDDLDDLVNAMLDDEVSSTMQHVVRSPRKAETYGQDHVGFWPPHGPEAVAAVHAQVDPAFRDTQDFVVVLWYANDPDHRKQYRGISSCRVCGQMNGSADYIRDGWTWPQGYSHYIEAHGVRPPQAFIDAALEAHKEAGSPPLRFEPTLTREEKLRLYRK